MTRRLTLLCVIFAGLLILGCERRDPPPKSSQLYDPEVDPHASILDDRADPDLVANQAAISRRVERDKPDVPAPTVPAAATSAEPATDEVTETTEAEDTAKPTEEVAEEAAEEATVEVTEEEVTEAKPDANAGAEEVRPTGLDLRNSYR